MTGISLTLLAAGKVERKPFTWACIDQSFDALESAGHLMRTFPKQGFRRIEASGAKRYSMVGRTIVSSEGDLTDEWRTFVCSLETEEYRCVIESITDLDLTGLCREITLWRYGVGDYLGPHTDKPEKVVTHIIYFSEPNWNLAHGGCLDILSSDHPASLIRRIEPLCGRSVILVRSDWSWHAVMPQRRDGYERRAVQVVFHQRALSYSATLHVSVEPTRL